jgi:nitroreductase
VIILVCGRPLQHDSPAGREAMLLSALYGASQNLLLAARALELGAVFTTLHVHGEDAIRAGLGIPDEAVIAGTIALGWPDAPTGRVRRRPVDDVLHWQSW